MFIYSLSAKLEGMKNLMKNIKRFPALLIFISCIMLTVSISSTVYAAGDDDFPVDCLGSVMNYMGSREILICVTQLSKYHTKELSENWSCKYTTFVCVNTPTKNLPWVTKLALKRTEFLPKLSASNRPSDQRF